MEAHPLLPLEWEEVQALAPPGRSCEGLPLGYLAAGGEEDSDGGAGPGHTQLLKGESDSRVGETKRGGGGV